MKISTLWYCFRQGIKNIKRNLLFSLASIGTIIACLFLFGLFYGVVINFESMMTTMEQSVAVTVFFDAGLSESEIKQIGEEIRVRPEVNTMDFMTADEAWAQFSKQIFQNDQEKIDAAFGTDNPLADYASYNITISNVEKQAEFVNFLHIS